MIAPFNKILIENIAKLNYTNDPNPISINVVDSI